MPLKKNHSKCSGFLPFSSWNRHERLVLCAKHRGTTISFPSGLSWEDIRHSTLTCLFMHSPNICWEVATCKPLFCCHHLWKLPFLGAHTSRGFLTACLLAWCGTLTTLNPKYITDLPWAWDRVPRPCTYTTSPFPVVFSLAVSYKAPPATWMYPTQDIHLVCIQLP